MTTINVLKALAGITGTSDHIEATNPEVLFETAEALESLSPLAQEIALARAAGQTLNEFLETHDCSHSEAREAWGHIDHHLARAMPGRVAEFVEDPVDKAVLKALNEGQTRNASRSGRYDKEKNV